LVYLVLGFRHLPATIARAFGPYPDEYAASRVLMNISRRGRWLWRSC
jgi:hypothetical protein